VITAWDISLGETFLSMLWFFLFIIWIWLLITIFGDLFRSEDLSGWGKAGWALLLIVLPYLGVFVYLVARGHQMTARAAGEAEARDKAMRSYVRDAAGTPSAAQEIERLAALQQAGQLSPEEFERAKSKILA
jgi:hypothetical protein